MHRKVSRSKTLALGGILGALTVLCVYFASVLPTNKLSLYALSSFFIAVLVIEQGVSAAWTFYGATSLLVFILVPEKLATLPYIMFFGLYGIVKFYLEKRKNTIFEFIVKFAYFNLVLAIALYFLMSFFVSQTLFEKMPIWLIVLALQPIFLIYDYAYTLFIKYYLEKLKKLLHIH